MGFFKVRRILNASAIRHCEDRHHGDEAKLMVGQGCLMTTMIARNLDLRYITLSFADDRHIIKHIPNSRYLSF